MVSIRKIVIREIKINDELRDMIADSTDDAGIRKLMMKDMRLVEAALEADGIIASLDESARSHFSSSSKHVKTLRIVTWVNPSRKTETVVRRLEDGSPNDAARTLYLFGTSP